MTTPPLDETLVLAFMADIRDGSDVDAMLRAVFQPRTLAALDEAVRRIAADERAYGGRWVYCTPELQKSGVDCSSTPRRPGRGVGHEHWVATKLPAPPDGEPTGEALLTALVNAIIRAKPYPTPEGIHAARSDLSALRWLESNLPALLALRAERERAALSVPQVAAQVHAEAVAEVEAEEAVERELLALRAEAAGLRSIRDAYSVEVSQRIEFENTLQEEMDALQAENAELKTRSGSILTDDEQQRLMLMQIYTATSVDGRDGLPQDEMEALLSWAQDVRVSHGLLENVLSGAMYVRMTDGEPSFSLTSKGEAEAKALFGEGAGGLRRHPGTSSETSDD